MKKVLLISGSPRDGNTDYILKEIHQNLKEETKLVLLRNLNFNHCNGCLACYHTGECVQKDDMNNLFNDLLSYDLIILGSPLYYGNVSGLTKQFIDRTIPAYESQSLKDKKIISIMVGGGEVKTTGEYHKQSIKGFIKYNKLNLINTYNFEGFEVDDLKNEHEISKEIITIIKEIENHL